MTLASGVSFWAGGSLLYGGVLLELDVAGLSLALLDP